MSSDPRKISNTYLLPQLSFAEAAELSYFGAKVIHPLTIKPLSQKNIPLRILNSLNIDPQQQGTLICGESSPHIRALAFREEMEALSLICLLGVAPSECLDLLDSLGIVKINYSPTRLSSILMVPRNRLWSIAQKLHDLLVM
jgi:aspartokinase